MVIRRGGVGRREVLGAVGAVDVEEVVDVELDARFHCGCPIDRCRARC